VAHKIRRSYMLDPDVIAKLDAAADRLHISRSGFINLILRGLFEKNKEPLIEVRI